MAVVVFDADKFRAAFPQFGELTDARLEYFFSVASEIVDNTDTSLIPYAPPKTNTREIVMMAIMCHLITLDQRGAGVVGPLTNATEGSVSAGYGVITSPQNAQWWNQTQCGATAWMLISRYLMGGRLYNGCFR